MQRHLPGKRLANPVFLINITVSFWTEPQKEDNPPAFLGGAVGIQQVLVHYFLKKEHKYANIIYYMYVWELIS